MSKKFHQNIKKKKIQNLFRKFNQTRKKSIIKEKYPNHLRRFPKVCQKSRLAYASLVHQSNAKKNHALHEQSRGSQFIPFFFDSWEKRGKQLVVFKRF